MQDADYRRMFDQVRVDLIDLNAAKKALENQLNLVNAKIDAMTKTHNALAPLVGEQPIPGLMDKIISASVDAIMDAGISVVVHSTLDAAPDESFTAATMRDRLAAQGWDWSKYANALATVHTVLVRGVVSGWAKEDTNANADGAKSFYSAKRIFKAPVAPPVSRVQPPPRRVG
jgi:hypothetical protein